MNNRHIRPNAATALRATSRAASFPNLESRPLHPLRRTAHRHPSGHQTKLLLRICSAGPQCARRCIPSGADCARLRRRCRDELWILRDTELRALRHYRFVSYSSKVGQLVGPQITRLLAPPTAHLVGSTHDARHRHLLRPQSIDLFNMAGCCTSDLRPPRASTAIRPLNPRPYEGFDVIQVPHPSHQGRRNPCDSQARDQLDEAQRVD